MRKELVITCSPHETRVAILEDGQLCEIYIEREREYALVGSIYKGRVTRVLPGMQSAFVDIGLETDAFLYVSDVLEEIEEYDQGSPGERPAATSAATVTAESPAEPSGSSAPEIPAAASQTTPSAPERNRQSGPRPNRRGMRHRGRHLPPSKFTSPRTGPPERYIPVILPGESLAKYRDQVQTPETAPSEETAAAGEAVTGESTGEPTLPGQEPPEAAPASIEELESREAASTEPEFEVAAEAEAGSTAEELFEGVAESETTSEATLSEAASGLTAGTLPAEPGEPTVEAAAGAGGTAPGELSPDEASALTETLAEVRQAEALSEAGEEAAELEAEAPAEGTTPETAVTRVEGPSSLRLQRPARHGQPRGRRFRAHRRRPQPVPRRTQQIGELLKPGQEVIVQITKEPLGKKGARITSHIALPGRFLVYMPTFDHIGISRKIASHERRARLRRLVESLREGQPGGFIVRTAAETASDEDLRADAEFLIRTWQEIRARAEQKRAPALLHRDLNLVERTLRDCLTREFTTIWVDSEEQYARVVEFVSRFQPELVNRVRLYTKETPLFEEMGIQQEIEKALRPKVWLKSGGYIVINHTEALVAIDVNTGKFVGRGSTRLEDTIVKTNIEAVKEIVRQIRLRDLGGIIVIDFIDMEERKNREKVLQALEEALRADRAPSKVLPFNEFGLVAITRKRTKQALERVLCQPCPYCSGSGMVKSVTTICYEIDTEARKMAQELDAPSLTLRVHPEIAKALKTREAHVIEELEKFTGKSVVIQSDPTLHWEHYDIY